MSSPNFLTRHFLLVHIATIVVLALCVPDVQAQTRKPLKVFVLVGQSNMQGHAHVRTLEHVGMDERTAPMLKEILDDDGSARIHKDIWISYLSTNGEKKGQLTTGFGADDHKIGPELMFGITMHRALDEPILIIKTAWGGKSLHTDFRPPSAGPFKFRQDQLDQFNEQGKDIEEIKKAKELATGHYYRVMIEHVQRILSGIPEVFPEYQHDPGYQLAGLVWFQGWNDMVDRGIYPDRNQKGGYDQYSELLAHFIRDVRKDLSAPELPIVIGVMGAGGPTNLYLQDQMRYQSIHQNFRDAMAAPGKLPEFQNSVRNVLTEEYWDMELVQLRAREAKIRQDIKNRKKEGELGQLGERAALDKLRRQEFTKRELDTLEKGVSNFEFHYLGSAKIMAGIGKGFAEAMLAMIESDKD